MAIKLARALSTGITADYWRIIGYRETLTQAWVDLALYASKEAREADSLPIEINIVEVPIGVVSTVDVRESVYPHLKETELNGGEDV